MKNQLNKALLEVQPDAEEIKEKPVPPRIRWVLYVIVTGFALAVTWAALFKVDRIVVGEGNLVTTSPTIVVQPMTTAAIRSIKVAVGDVVEKGQILAVMDPTFAGADLDRLTQQGTAYGAQIRRIRAELDKKNFTPLAREGEDGRLQARLFSQRKLIYGQRRKLSREKIGALEARLALNKVQQQGKEKQARLLRDIEGTVGKMPKKDADYRLRLLDAQRNRFLTANEAQSLEAEAQVIAHELAQAGSEWRSFVAQWSGELMEQEVQLRTELEKINEEIRKARRLHELVELRAPEEAVVLNLADRSVGSIIQQAEAFITLVPLDAALEARVNIQSKEIGRIRTGDTARVKLDAFPFQRHDTLPGKVRVISENAFQSPREEEQTQTTEPPAVYRVRIGLMSTQLRNVPQGFRLMPGMKARAEIKVGQRPVITYFLYPIIRAFDESLREP
jgi:HlyD family secretion protein